MNFGHSDMVILTTMSLAIVMMSFTFPAMGLADSSNETSASEIPEFNVSASNWDIAGDFPDSPGTPSSGTLIWDESLGGGGADNQIWLDGDSNGGMDTTIVNLGSSSNTNMTATLTYYNETDFDTTNETFDAEGESFELELNKTLLGNTFNWTVEYEVEEYRDENTSDFYTEVDFVITDQPGDDASWIERIPIIGAVVSAGEQLAAMLGWVGAVLYWGIAATIEVALTLVVLLFDIMTFAISLAQWLTTTYSGLITATTSWASVVVAIPGVLLFAEFAKLAMIGISLLPFT